MRSANASKTSKSREKEKKRRAGSSSREKPRSYAGSLRLRNGLVSASSRTRRTKGSVWSANVSNVSSWLSRNGKGRRWSVDGLSSSRRSDRRRIDCVKLVSWIGSKGVMPRWHCLRPGFDASRRMDASWVSMHI